MRNKSLILIILLVNLFLVIGIFIYYISMIFLGSVFPFLDNFVVRYLIPPFLAILPIPYILKGKDNILSTLRFFGSSSITLIVNFLLVFFPYFFANLESSEKLKEGGSMIGPTGTGDLMAWATLLIIISVLFVFNIIPFLVIFFFLKIKSKTKEI